VTGAAGGEIDHVELVGPAADPRNDARNFVLCPGGAYDRSPCGTGTSAKLACLAADGKLAADTPWRQESVIGSVFTGRYVRPAAAIPGLPADAVLPLIHGRAHVTLDANLVFDPGDPFAWGLA
jgi:proline racemase